MDKYFCDIRPISVDEYDCFQVIVATMANYYSYDFELMFTTSWGFKFIPSFETECDKEGYGDRISPGWDRRIDVFSILERHHGITIERNDDIGTFNLHFIIKNELEKSKMVVVKIDSYWCPWSLGYKKHHIVHHCIIIGFNESKNIYFCVDPYMNTKINEYPIDDFIKSYIAYYSFKFGKINISDINWKEFYLKALENLNYGKLLNSFEQMRSFAGEVIENPKYLESIKNCTDYIGVPLFENIRIIGSSRINFSKALNYIFKYHPLEKIKIHSEQISQAGKLWGIIRMNFIRAVMSQNPSDKVHMIADKIIQASEFEEAITDNIYDFVLK